MKAEGILRGKLDKGDYLRIFGKRGQSGWIRKEIQRLTY